MSDVNVTASKRRGRPPRSSQPAENAAEAFIKDATGFSVEEIRQDSPISRPSMRPSIREEDPRVAAARRASEIRGHLGDMDTGTDEFRAPPAPPGWEYEWKRRVVMGQEDPAYQVHLARMGWEAVPTSRHPEEMPGQGNHPVIERKGMSLMMRPAVISDEARAIERRKAGDQIRAKEAQLNASPDGQFERNDPRVKPQIKKGYSPIEVPKD
jgi:hypothetical protein